MRTLFAVVLCALSTSANAGFWDGNQLMKGCNTDRSFIVGYVTGWADKHEPDTAAMKDHVLLMLKSGDEKLFESARDTAKVIQMGICLPDQVTAGQIADVYCKYLRENPAYRHRTGNLLLELSMMDAFPCK